MSMGTRRHVLLQGLLHARQAWTHGQPQELASTSSSSPGPWQRLFHACSQLLYSETPLTQGTPASPSAESYKSRRSQQTAWPVSTQRPGPKADWSRQHTPEVLESEQHASSIAAHVKALKSKPGGCSTQELVRALTQVTVGMTPRRLHFNRAAGDPTQSAVTWLLGELQTRVYALSVHQVSDVIKSVVCSLSCVPVPNQLLAQLLQHMADRDHQLLTAQGPPHTQLPYPRRLALAQHLSTLAAHRECSLSQDHGVLLLLLRQLKAGCGSVNDDLSLLRVLEQVPQRWVPTSHVRELGYEVVTRLMHRLPSWTTFTAPLLLRTLSRLNMLEDPAALVYTTAHAHLCAQRGLLSIEGASNVLYSMGVLNKQAVTFSGALSRPELHTLATQAQRDVAAALPDLSPSPAQSLLHRTQHASNWQWPPRDLHSILNSQVDPRHQKPVFARHPPDDKPRACTPVLHIKPGPPGAPLHWQEAPLDVSTFHLAQPPALPAARLQLLSTPALHSHPSAMIQMLLDLARYVADRMTPGSQQHVGAALYGLSHLRLMSGPLIAATHKHLASMLWRGQHISAVMIATSLANLHAMGTSGPAVAALADAFATGRINFSSKAQFQDELHVLCNMCWALSTVDQPGTPAWRRYVYNWLHVFHTRGWRQLQPVQARQLAAYLQVLRELEWEAARFAGLPDCPPVVWSKVPATLKSGLLPWHHDWVRDAEALLFSILDSNQSRSTISAFQSGIRAALVKLSELSDGWWLPPRLEATTDAGHVRVDILMVSPGDRARLAVEADGPWHFALNDPGLLMGSTARRMRSLARQGYMQLNVPFWDWAPLQYWPAKVNYLKQRLRELLSSGLPDKPELVEQLVGPPVQHKDVALISLSSLCEKQPSVTSVIKERLLLVSQMTEVADMLADLATSAAQEQAQHGPSSPADRPLPAQLSATIAVMEDFASRLGALVSQQPQACRGLPRLDYHIWPDHTPGGPVHPMLAKRCQAISTRYSHLRLGLSMIQDMKALLVRLKQTRSDLNEAMFLHGGGAGQTTTPAPPHTTQHVSHPPGATTSSNSTLASRDEGLSGEGAGVQLSHQMADLEGLMMRVMRVENLLRARRNVADMLMNSASFEGLVEDKPGTSDAFLTMLSSGAVLEEQEDLADALDEPETSTPGTSTPEISTPGTSTSEKATPPRPVRRSSRQEVKKRTRAVKPQNGTN